MKRLYLLAAQGSWDALVFFLPLTSLPLLSRVMGGTDVAPLSMVFLAILILIWFLPRFLRGAGVPIQSVPLIIFALAAVVSSLLAFFQVVPSFKNEGLWKNEFSSLVSLGIGVCFYLVASLWISDEAKLKRFFRIVNLSGGLALLYAMVQVIFIVILKKIPPILAEFQDLISASQTLFVGRINGLALEPSWLAHQLNMFYIPIWFGLSIKKISFHKFRIARFSLENLLLAASLIALFLTKTRTGWLVFLTYGAYLFLLLMNTLRKRIAPKWSFKNDDHRKIRIFQAIFNVGFWFLLMIFLLGVLVLAGWIMTIIDPRMATFFDLQSIRDEGILGWASYLLFAERIIYWMAGFSIFLENPILGVGLGNSGYFIPSFIASFGYSSPEILRIFLEDPFLPNPKNLWVRILAETGIVGFSLFVSWLWVQWKTARAAERLNSPLAQAVGLTGQITIIGLIVEGFSLDTFALPYYWMTLGLVVAVFRFFSLRANSQMRDPISAVTNTPSKPAS